METPVEDAVAVVVTREMEKLLPEMMCRFIVEAANGLTVDDVNDTPCTDSHKALSNAMSEFLFAAISKHIFDCVRSGKVTMEENVRSHSLLTGKLKKEIRRCIKQFISQINDSDEGRSSLFD